MQHEIEETAVIHQFTLRELLDYIEKVDETEIAFINDAFHMNLELLEEGLQSSKTKFGPMLKRRNE